MIDADNELGRLIGYKIIPNGFFIDEEGRLVGQWIGFSVDRPECREAVDAFREGRLEPFARTPQGPVGAPGVPPGPVGGSGRLSGLEQELYETRVRLGAQLLAAGKKEQAAAEWGKALRMDRENFVLRKQIWALRFPEKFHPTIDFDWQKEQLAREQAEEAADCGPDGCEIPTSQA